MSGRGYRIGATLAPSERPWPFDWEQNPSIDDGHAHDWECVLLKADGQRRRRMEEVVRCQVCSAPRCGHSRSVDPCMERRHHDGVHIRWSGKFDPLGGY